MRRSELPPHGLQFSLEALDARGELGDDLTRITVDHLTILWAVISTKCR